MQEKVDLRLFVVALFLWLGAAGIGLVDRRWVVLCIPLGAWLIGWHRSIAVMLIATLIAGGLLMDIRERSLRTNLITKYLDQKSTLTITSSVRSDPVLGQPKNENGYIKPASTTFLTSTISFIYMKQKYHDHIPLRITTAEQVHFLPGSVISCSGVMYSTSEKRVAGLFAVRGVCTLIHGADLFGRITGDIRSDYRNASQRVGGAAGALIPGLVLGDTSLESAVFKNQMLESGLTHLTAVSGENFAIIAGFMGWFLQWFVRKLQWRLIINSLVLIGFIFLVRPSPSVLRATVMVAVMIIAQFRGARGSALPALALAIAVLILNDPFEAIDPGFALSVAATAGILLWSKPLSAWLSSFIRYPRFCELFAIPLAANLLCTPITIAISGQLSLTTLLCNLFVDVVIAPITVVGFGAALITPLFPAIGYWLLASQRYFSAWICLVARVGSSVPVIRLPTGFAGAGVGISVMAIFLLLAKALARGA